LRGWQFIATLNVIATLKRLAGGQTTQSFSGRRHGGLPTNPDIRQPTMDKKAKKKIQALNQRIQKLQQQLAGAKKQMDDPRELKTFQEQLAAA